MARWTGEPEITAVLAAAEAWRTRCLEASTSVFTDAPLWTVPNLTDLLNRFAGNPIDDSSRDFLNKLEEQLKGAPREVIQVAAEALWFLFLFPSPSLMRADTKREQVSTVWAWSGEVLPNSPLLDDAHLHGVGHPGTAYMTYRYREFEYLLRTVISFKSNTQAEQKRLMTENRPWEFVRWLDEQVGSDRRLVRNALLYLIFPDEFERNTSQDHRRQIYETFKNKLPADDRIKSRTKTNADYDRAILEIRKVLEGELNTNEFDFYQPALKNQWFAEYRDAKRKDFTSWFDEFFSDRGLQLNQSGRDTKLQKLQEKFPISAETGFWENSAATAKPPRWLVHFDLTSPTLTVSVPQEHRAGVVGFANTKGGNSGALIVRVLGIAKTADQTYEPMDVWEWLLLFCFPGGLKPGSAAQAFDDFNPATGELTYMGESIPYIYSALLTQNTPEETFSAIVNGQKREISFKDATAALAQLIHVNGTGAKNG